MNNQEITKIIDMRSDTVTKPTRAMREAMMNAEVGDDVYGDDPTVNTLEEKAAQALGKEAALFVPSGTFGNQLALFTYVRPGNEVILGEHCHIVAHEAGAAAVIAGAQLRTVDFPGYMPDVASIEARIRVGNDIHEPETALICLENALANGRVVPLSVMEEIYNMAKRRNIPLHLDGARIFNAATALGVDASDIARYADSIMFCLSKGLCAPIGSMLVGKQDFIEKARRKRKLLGGGMRQAGVLAAPGIIALEEMSKRLSEDHDNAKALGKLLSEIPGVRVDLDTLDINMVFFNIKETGYPESNLPNQAANRGLLLNGAENGLFRLVTHHGVDAADVQRVANIVREILETHHD